MRPGLVSLVGAGPGPLDLLTLRALRAIEDAEVLLYDRLVSEEVLSRAAAGALKLYAGMDRGRSAAARHARVVAAMIGHARLGRRVVRLKGGDPVVFGRGGEEAEALALAGIPVELIPGVSACIAAPELAGIPLTYRGMSASFGVFTGRRGRGMEEDAAMWRAAAGVETAIFLMGVERLAEIAARLQRLGRPADDPAAVIERAGAPGARCVVARLDDIASAARELAPPATLIVGPVVSRRLTAPIGVSDLEGPCSCSSWP